MGVIKILDMSAGNRAIWFDKECPYTTFLDCRVSTNPTILCDIRELPLTVGIGYDLVVFDPPHVNFGKNAEMSKTYGHHTTEEIREIIQKSTNEAHKVSKENAFMAFKWNDHDQKLEKILRLMPLWEPLFGHKVSQRIKHSSTTYWVLLKRRQVKINPPDGTEVEGK